MKILNLTQHPASKEQVEAGVFEPQNKNLVKDLLTFHQIPTKQEMEDRSTNLAKMAKEEFATLAVADKAAMIGGAPFFMSLLETALMFESIQPLYAFSRRVVEEKQLEDGSVEKKMVFKHIGFVYV